MTIYTIGYQKLPIEQLDAIMQELDCDLVDVRFKPFSRNPSYTKRALEAHYGERYMWKGDCLGGIPKGETHDHVTPAGLVWLKTRKRNSLLLCLEEHPAHCHRHLLICGPHFPQALHIYEGGCFTASEVSEMIEHPSEASIESVRDLDCWT